LYLKDCDGLISLIANPASLTVEEKQVARGSRTAYWALAAVFLAVYVGSMFTPGLLDDADSTHAEAAREMVVTGDYVTLHVNGVRYLEKAPLPYWLVAFSYRIFGVNEFSTRLPMVLSVMLLGMLGFCWGRRAFGERAGIYAALFVYTCAGAF
jgi:4-amino-4-deoxy-L-arabinose transferase-like glycosyltransferase